MSERAAVISEFLQAAGWGSAHRAAFPGDASTRSYERLTMDGKTAVLMNAPKGAEAPSEPEGASAADREALGYNAVARLAGPNIEAFVCLANELKIRGFSAPEIYATDLSAGLLLLEDFKHSVYASVIVTEPLIEPQLYEAAIDTLAAIYRSSFPQVMHYQETSWRVRDYDTLALTAEADLFLDWYAKDFGYEIQPPVREQWHVLWREAFDCLDSHAAGLCLRDFHAENLFWLPSREGVANVGLIDFQDGLFVHPAYDLVSFIEDARRDVSPDLTQPLIERFCDRAGIACDANFMAAYAVMGAQRNAKILGIFVRLAERDNKPAYRELIPRVQENFKGNLNNPKLTPLRDWIAQHVPNTVS